ncbi:Asr1405/Asl0597 family protein [Pseudanabaena sp. FACHB-2040]|uniref:Asr1405/Asl0597 family protein n=1 Tax=Pseudanabaena sp. FACHB-2040 TaxID=2692859 RepID=UPI001682D183|nr:Asr1405/Asl0597 family protein [Pseudanabaena sp. FACHB-2040]MBD2256678.1 hypothetical protein [Pseudanabaena sp. FACHB-2040]
MKSVEPDYVLSDILEFDRIDRWNIYNRLQQLAISSHCATGKPLQVKISTAGDAIQLWSVIRQCTAPRQVNVDYLEDCWHLRVGQSRDAAA